MACEPKTGYCVSCIKSAPLLLCLPGTRGVGGGLQRVGLSYTISAHFILLISPLLRE